MALNHHGNITLDSIEKRHEETAKYGPVRVQLSRILVTALDTLGWKWILDSGQLLASWRDNGKMIPHDDDFDFVVFTEEVTKESSPQDKESFGLKMLKEIREKVPSKFEMRLINSYAFKIEVYDAEYGSYPFRENNFHNVTCDLQFLAPVKKEDPETLIWLHETYYNHNLTVPKKFVFPIKENGAVFEGHQYNAPSDVKSYLECMYGYLGKGAVFDKENGVYKKKEE